MLKDKEDGEVEEQGNDTFKNKKIASNTCALITNILLEFDH
jgi:hypothetical protein